jgi:hypothetical protein
MVLNGELLELPTPVHLTGENGFGLWPTPNKWDGNRGPLSQSEINTKDHMINLITAVYLKQGRGGSLNPQWIEWLMGWPIGHTELQPSATDKCPLVSGSHGMSYPKAFADWLDSHGVIW